MILINEEMFSGRSLLCARRIEPSFVEFFPHRIIVQALILLFICGKNRKRKKINKPKNRKFFFFIFL
jgi:hypothetical protein